VADYRTNSENHRIDPNPLKDYVNRIQKESTSFKSVRKSTDFEDSVERLFNELQSLLISKHDDYGPKNISDSPGGPLNGLRVRIHDKQARINNLIDNEKSPKHESLEDSFKDMANYAIIALLVLRGKWPS
jgi:Nucleotide modification associated domain 1